MATQPAFTPTAQSHEHVSSPVRQDAGSLMLSSASSGQKPTTEFPTDLPRAWQPSASSGQRPISTASRQTMSLQEGHVLRLLLTALSYAIEWQACCVNTLSHIASPSATLKPHLNPLCALCIPYHSSSHHSFSCNIVVTYLGWKLTLLACTAFAPLHEFTFAFYRSLSHAGLAWTS